VKIWSVVQRSVLTPLGFLFLKNGQIKFDFLVFFHQFNVYVDLADLKMILADFWTQNDTF